MTRKLFLKILKLISFDFNIRHQYTGHSFFLNLYNHKGYWFHGKKREKETVSAFYKFINKNDFVLEIGAHIGYFSTLFSDIVGKNGKVIVFEPSKNNLDYLKININNLPNELSKNISIIEKGAGDVNGNLSFYIDPISGQNNSFVENFEGFYKNRIHSAETKAELIHEIIEVVKLDTFFMNFEQFPNFVKIDVEGFEWNVIKGFKEIINISRPKLMIEIQADEENIISYFLSIDYKIFNDNLKEIISIETFNIMKTPNIFFLPN